MGCCILLFLCTTVEGNAPIVNGWQKPPPVHSSLRYTIQPGDTLYGVAGRYSLSPSDLAKWNGIKPPYRLKVGEVIYLHPISQSDSHRSSTKNTSKKSSKTYSKQSVANKTSNSHHDKNQKAKQKSINKSVTLANKSHKSVSKKQSRRGHSQVTHRAHGNNKLQWHWPAKGIVVKNYSAANRSYGIDIAGRAGEPVVASAPGTVVYVGNGLRGYGNMVILKHNRTYLTAYAHNRKIKVKEGQRVRAGQIIATMGSTESNRVMVHFEIRKNGKPVNPMGYLPKQRR